MVVAKYLAAMVEKDSSYLKLKTAHGAGADDAGRCMRRRWWRPSPTSTTATATGARR